jgi:uncharacterized protein
VNPFIDRLLSAQARRPYRALGLALLVTVIFGFFASKLDLRTQYDALLPDDQPSVRELRRLEKRTSAAQTILVLLEGRDRAALRDLGDAVVPRLLSLGPDVISSAEDGPHEARAFLKPRSGLFLDQADLAQLAGEVDARWDYEVAKAGDLLLDDGAPPPPLPSEAEVKQMLAKEGKSLPTGRFPDGYYERPDGTALIVVARSPIAGGDLTRVRRALDEVHREVDAARAASPAFSAVHVAYAGDMPTGFTEYGVVLGDLLSVGATGLALVLAAVLLYFLRVRAVLMMGLTILVGLTWTFGLTQIVIGHLNVATAFLISIVGGNGSTSASSTSRATSRRGRGGRRPPRRWGRRCGRRGSPRSSRPSPPRRPTGRSSSPPPAPSATSASSRRAACSSAGRRRR